MGDATTDTTGYTGEFPSNALRSEGAMLHEKDLGDIKGIDDGETDSHYLPDDKMIKVCNKLIDVFMVDRPTPTDWRRLLAFSKEWENIRPHFFKHCQEKADLESDPEMKHKLFRLCRKLKEIDDDVQRHNELINAVKVAPDEISSIVAKRRKDFTKEFFVHLHTVAESHFENAAEQNALAKMGNE